VTVSYDPTVSLGTILQLGGIIVTLIVVYTQVISRLARLETKMDALWKWFEDGRT
jgi:hypothetical protein